MNGFERSSGQDAEAEARELVFPDDFSPDEMTFATQLRETFALEREELPPLYVQTLMEQEWDDLAAAQRQRALIPAVFSRLGLPVKASAAPADDDTPDADTTPLPARPARSLRSIRPVRSMRYEPMRYEPMRYEPMRYEPMRYEGARRHEGASTHPTLAKLHALPGLRALPDLPELPAWSALAGSAAQFVSTSRTLIATVAAIAAVMLFSVLLTTPSFAQGLQLLLAHTGVQQVEGYPDGAQMATLSSGPMTAGPSTILWLGPQVGDFRYQGTYLLKAESWSQGPIVDVRYSMPGKTNGDGTLDIREFQVSSNYGAVLQIVQEGAASQVQMTSGASAVFVNGMWKQNGAHMVWSMNSRSELISEQNGIVCWMVADPRDGMGVLDLIDAAGHFQTTPSPFRTSRQLGVGVLGSELTPWLRNPSDGELYRLVARGESLSSTMGALVLVRGGSPNAPISPNGTNVVGAN